MFQRPGVNFKLNEPTIKSSPTQTASFTPEHKNEAV